MHDQSNAPLCTPLHKPTRCDHTAFSAFMSLDAQNSAFRVRLMSFRVRLMHKPALIDDGYGA